MPLTDLTPLAPRGTELVDKDLAVVMNHLTAYATVVVLVTSDHAPVRVALLFGEHDFRPKNTARGCINQTSRRDVSP